MRMEIDNLVHAYPTGEKALRGVSLVLEGDEPVAIIGQNGAGKTTLVKHFNGILRPTEGHVRIDGVDITERSTAQWSREVGYVFQNPDDQLFLDSVRKELAFGPERMGVGADEIDRRVRRVADLVGLGKKLDTHPFDLSAAEKKFCTIGAVLAMEPKAVVFDEPTCGQDLRGNRRLAYIIASLKAAGVLCVTISHDMKFVTTHFPRVIVMCQGQVLMDGPARRVFADADTLARSFVTPPPITRVAAQAGLGDTVFTVPAFMNAVREANAARETTRERI
ncbi:ABC transporter [Bifidobacterium lemurum]|uniref:ABC transporter n=1 Tax=Bifidobacterium lemurum TaxID=1603886 RepID=A0A261FSJ1_9BIFI|nr:ABC transporter ATP-binding protein [Bifidobacterium lemurum]OZG61945.1 ABC transporter [Bifidobacterium lemurum]QOL35276.1 ABC transporter ATP-binding protein [Bifidobacterium lemurum]